MTKAEYIERVTRWLMPDRDDPELAAAARERTTLDGVYGGTSQRIHGLVRLAYLRGVRRGAGCAWEAQRPVRLRARETPMAGDGPYRTPQRPEPEHDYGPHEGCPAREPGHLWYVRFRPGVGMYICDHCAYAMNPQVGAIHIAQRRERRR